MEPVDRDALALAALLGFVRRLLDQARVETDQPRQPFVSRVALLGAAGACFMVAERRRRKIDRYERLFQEVVPNALVERGASGEYEACLLYTSPSPRDS